MGIASILEMNMGTPVGVSFKDRKKVSQLYASFSKFREIEDMMPLTLAQSFLTVALYPGESLQDLAERTDLSISNMSRYLLMLTSRGRRSVANDGYGLIVRESDPDNLRRNIYYLSPKGEDFLKHLVEAS